MDFTKILIISGVLFVVAIILNVIAYVLEKKTNKKKLDIINESKIKNEND